MRVPLPAAMITMSGAMRMKGLKRFAIIGALLVTAWAVTGCAAPAWVYDRAPALLLWRLDDYAEFDRGQKARAEAEIDRWFAWNRAVEVPQYAELLGRAKQQVQSELSAELVCQWNERVQDRLQAGYAAMEGGILDYLISATPQQLTAMEERFQRRQAEFQEEYVQGDATERREASVKRARKWAQRLYGVVTPVQLQELTQMVAASPYDAVRWNQERQLRQREFMAWLRQSKASSGLSSEAWRMGLRVHWQAAFESPRPEFRRYQQELARYNCGAIARFHNATSRQQRQHAASLLADWQTAFQRIAAEAVVRGR